jgi:hypothetical protein
VQAWNPQLSGDKGLPKERRADRIKSPPRSGSVVLYVPRPEVPPYEAHVFAYRKDRYHDRGEGAGAPVPEREPYCLQERPLAECVLEARTRTTRCRLGLAPRAQCHPLTHVAELPPERPFAGDRARLEAEGFERNITYNEGAGRLNHVTCPTSSSCTLVYESEPEPKLNFVVRYSIFADRDPRCWYVGHKEIVEAPDDLRLMVAAFVTPGPSDLPKGCLYQ